MSNFSTEINKIKINCTQNATKNNQVLLIHQSIYCGNAYIPDNKKKLNLFKRDGQKNIKFLNFFFFFTLSDAFIYMFNNHFQCSMSVIDSKLPHTEKKREVDLSEHLTMTSSVSS